LQRDRKGIGEGRWQRGVGIRELWEKWGRSIEKMGREGVIKY